MFSSKGEYMEREITDTIRDIDEKEWNTLVGTDLIDRVHAWYRTVEDSRIRDMQYVFLKEGKTLKAAACSYVYSQKLYKEMPFLEVRSPLGKSASFFSETPQHTRMLLEGLEAIRAKEKMKGILILDFKREELNTVKKDMKGFTYFPLRENTYMDLNFSDFDDYLSTLSRKARGNIRNTLNKARKRWGIKSVVTNEVSQWRKVAHKLQGYICEKHEDYRWLLTERFYEALETHLKDYAELLIFFKDDTPLASGLCLNSPTICQCKAAGVDPRYRKYQAYFLMYYEEIKRAIERNQKRIYFGTTAYAFKEKLGSKKEELFGVVKLKNPLLHLGLQSYISVSRIAGKKL